MEWVKEVAIPYKSNASPNSQRLYIKKASGLCMGEKVAIPNERMARNP